MRTLDSIGIGETVTVREIKCRPRTRFYDLGILPGSEITKLRASPKGDPVAYSVKGTVIALRSSDARKIIVK